MRTYQKPTLRSGWHMKYLNLGFRFTIFPQKLRVSPAARTNRELTPVTPYHERILKWLSALETLPFPTFPVVGHLLLFVVVSSIYQLLLEAPNSERTQAGNFESFGV